MEVEVRGPGVGPSEREKIVDEGAQPDRLRIDGVQRAGDSATRASGCWRTRATPARITASGVRSSWLVSAANSRWRRSEARMGTRARVAYRDPIPVATASATRPPASSTSNRVESVRNSAVRSPITWTTPVGAPAGPAPPVGTGTDRTRTGLPWYVVSRRVVVPCSAAP